MQIFLNVEQERLERNRIAVSMDWSTKYHKG